MTDGVYGLPISVPGFSELVKPPARIHQVTSLHRDIVVGSHEKTVLRRNKGLVGLRDLVGHQVPNIKAHMDILQAAQIYQIVGLWEAATARFRELVLKFRDHSEVERLLAAGLPFSLKL